MNLTYVVTKVGVGHIEEQHVLRNPEKARRLFYALIPEDARQYMGADFCCTVEGLEKGEVFSFGGSSGYAYVQRCVISDEVP